RGKRTRLAGKMEKDPPMEVAFCKVVRRREAEHFRKLSRSTSEPRRFSGEQGGNYLGRRTRRETHPHGPTTASRGLPFRECAEAQQNQKGRSGHHLSPQHS